MGSRASTTVFKEFSETDFTEDLKEFDVPTLIIHGDDDQIVPIGASAHISSKLIPGATLKILSGRTTWPFRLKNESMKTSGILYESTILLQA